MAQRTVTVGIRMRMADAIAAVRNYRQEWQKSREEMHKNMAAHRDAVTQLSNTATVAGATLMAGVGAAVFQFAKFDAQMSNVNAVLRESDENMQRLREAALAAGKSTVYSATEAAQAIEELGKAGISTEDILSGGLDGALAVAASGGLDVAKAAEIAALAMQQFGLAGKDIPHVADLLAAAAGKSLGSVEDLGMGLQQSGLVLNQFGISIEEGVGALAAFAKAGLIGSDAGTSLKTMLMMLANPSKESAGLMEELGINAYDAAGQFVGLADLAGQLETKMAGLTQAQRDQALAQIFGSDALRAANVLYQEGAQGIRDWELAVNDSGYAAEVAADRMDNLRGDWERFMSTVESALVGAGSGADGFLRGLVQGATDAVDAFSALPAPVQTTGLTVAAIAGASLLAAGGLGRLVVSAAETRESLRELEVTGGRTTRVMARMARGAGVATAAFGTLAAVNAATNREVLYDLEQLTTTLERFGASGQATGQMATLWGDDLNRLESDMVMLNKEMEYTIANTWNTAGAWLTLQDSWSDDTPKQAKERLAALDQALADMVESGRVAEAAATFAQLEAVAAEAGVSMEELTAGMPLYQIALEGAKTQTAEVSEATRVYADHLGVVPELASAAQEGISQFDQALKAITETLFGVEEAEDRVATIVNAATAEFQENGFAIDGNSEAALANRATLRDLIAAYLDQISAVAESTGSQEEAMAVAEDLEGDFRSLAKQLGLSEDQIDDYAAAFDDIPTWIETTVMTTYKYRYQNAKPAPGGPAVPGLADGGYFGYADGGPVQRYPTGGFVRGAGGPRTDSINARLSNGEFVINAAATRRYRALLEAINSGRGPQLWRRVTDRGGSPYASASGGNVTATVRLIVDPRGADQELMRVIRKIIRVDAGGNTQKALGRR